MTDDVKAPRVRPFANGSEAVDWYYYNCLRCALRGEPDAQGAGPCPMETEIARGFILGDVDATLAEQYGATLRDGYAEMPDECAQFTPCGRCEYLVRPRARCDQATPLAVVVDGHTRSICASHLRAYRTATSQTSND